MILIFLSQMEIELFCTTSQFSPTLLSIPHLNYMNLNLMRIIDNARGPAKFRLGKYLFKHFHFRYSHIYYVYQISNYMEMHMDNKLSPSLFHYMMSNFARALRKNVCGISIEVHTRKFIINGHYTKRKYINFDPSNYGFIKIDGCWKILFE